MFLLFAFIMLIIKVATAATFSWWWVGGSFLLWLTLVLIHEINRETW